MGRAQEVPLRKMHGNRWFWGVKPPAGENCNPRGVAIMLSTSMLFFPGNVSIMYVISDQQKIAKDSVPARFPEE